MSEQVLESYAADRAARLRAPRSFTFEGEQFTYVPAIPAETLIRFLDRDGLSGQQILTLCDETAIACLEPDSQAAWTRIRQPDHQPLPLGFGDVIWLADQIITRASGLPTERPAVSSDGPPEATVTTSSAVSPSTAEAPTG